LDSDKQLSGVSFPFIEFWGGFDYIANGVLYLYELPEVPRIFRWRPGYTYANHRPPTVLDERGRPLDPAHWIGGSEMRRKKIFMRHYSYVLPKQALQKVGYYANVNWTDAFRETPRWFRESYAQLKAPLFLNERGFPVLQWLERYTGDHPQQITQLRQDLAAGKLGEEQRPVTDIEALLNSKFYAAQVTLARAFLSVFWALRSVWKALRGLFAGNRTKSAPI
jgi:hypothetical protein